MSNDQVTAIRTFLNKSESEIAMIALDAAGIESVIRSDDCGGMRLHLWVGEDIELLVSVTDAAAAIEVLETEITVRWDGGDDDEAS